MVAQVLPLPLSDGSADFAGQATALLDDFPNTRLAIYAEPHLLICSGTCSFDRMERIIATRVRDRDRSAVPWPDACASGRKMPVRSRLQA
jgi:hypothetical protein